MSETFITALNNYVIHFKIVFGIGYNLEELEYFLLHQNTKYLLVW